jgi:membrane-associated phospholipid phosphatase
MFQSEPIVWLQSFSSASLTWLSLFVTTFGYTKYYVALALVIAFGVRFRVGFLLLQMLLWAHVITTGLKELLALPRPADIDGAVQLLGTRGANRAGMRMVTDGFWRLPIDNAIQYVRSLPAPSYGFPSGHVAAATTFWLGAFLFVRSRALAVVGAIAIVSTALARMYLGRHFLADVLGGLLIGLTVVAATHWALGRASALNPPTNAVSTSPMTVVRRPQLRWLLLLAMSLLILAPGLAPHLRTVGRLVGVNAAFWLLVRTGLPDDGGSLAQRLGRVALALVIYAIAAPTVEAMVGLIGLHATPWGEFVAGIGPPHLYLLGPVIIGRRLRLYPHASSNLLAATRIPRAPVADEHIA